MPKTIKSTKGSKSRTKAKGLSRNEKQLTAEESKKIKGGLDPTSVKLPSPLGAGNHQPPLERVK
jgi:hypothetical protein